MKHFLFLAMAGLTGCGDLDYPQMNFQSDGTRIIASGVIDGETLALFQVARAENPQADTLVLLNVGGSVDDDANLVFSREVRNAGFTTVVPSNGMVASGGTDLFLAGRKRVLQPGACVGVHSWSNGIFDGSDLPRSDPEHQRYLQYYRAIGTDGEFYWFTLDAATADGMYWMTADEANRFDMTSAPTSSLSQGAICEDRS